MKKLGRFALLILIALSGCTKRPSSEEETPPPTPLSVAIYRDETRAYDVTVDVDNTLNLEAKVLPEDAAQDVVWSIENTTLATISETGLLTGISPGETMVNVHALNYPDVKSSLFLTVKPIAEQTGVGSGTSPEDPLFKGYEGDGPLEVYFLETYKIYADSLLIKKGNIEILIDAGWKCDGEMNRDFLNEKVEDGRLDMVIASHGDADHVQGIPYIVSDISYISSFLDYGRAGGESGAYKQLISNRVQSDGAVYYTALDSINKVNGANNRYYFTSEFYVDVLNTGAYSDTSSGNANSLALLFTYKDFKFFTAGDLTSSSEASLLTNEVLPEVSLYKASHHGSHGSNSQPLMDTLNPYMVAIAATKAGSYNKEPAPPSPSETYNLDGTKGHPASAAIERIYKIPRTFLNLNVYWNAVNGTMKFSTYGRANDLVMEGSTPLRGYYDLTITGGTPVWNDELQDFENKVTGEENTKLHETKIFEFRGYNSYLPSWVTEG
ncbi:MAG: Ig-like domain-containing protein [Bacillota bacterium]|jgi:beta-lactamase superfamily II metal-dependent hydrolase|nr:Ig-like domain-containing protein [Bacillota bacterium]